MANNSLCDMKRGKNTPAAFLKLKPLYVNFLKDCSVENIEKIEKILKTLDCEAVNSLQEFIVLPFRAHLSTKLNEKVVIKCVNFLKQVFKKSSVNSWNFFADIFDLMISQISDPKDINKVSSASEELKLSICENILTLIQHSSEDILNEMYSLSFRPNLAHAFYVLNLLLIYEKSKTLRKAILSTIGALTYNEMYLVKRFEKTEQIASESLASCFPGLSTVLQKVACGDIIQGHSIIVMALNILTDLIVLVVGDESYERGIVNDSSSEIYYIAYKCGKYSQFLEPIVMERIPIVMKDEEWFKTVSEKVEILARNLTILSSYDHWKVRLEFLKLVKSLLFKCTRTLENCIPIILPSVFGLTVDNNDIVSSYSEELLFSFSEKLSNNLKCDTLNSVIEDNIDKLTLQLMKCKFSANETRKLATLKNLQGYLEILGLSLNKFIFSISHLERIILTLLTLLEFDISVLNLVEEIPTLENFDISYSLWPKKRFKFFESEEILVTICKICYSLGHVGNCRLLIDYLLEKLSLSDLYSLQCIFIIGSIIRGLANKSNIVEKYSELINDVLEVFLSPSMFDVPIHNNDIVHLQTYKKDTLDLDVPNSTFNKNKLQICLLLEAIANCAECLASNFKIHLMKVLCPVMEKTGNSNFIISQCGRICLYSIAKSCDYNSISELIKDNADYITSIIMINFHEYVYKTEVAIVLRVVMEQSNSDAIILFRELIFQLLNILDYNQDKAYHFMIVLYSVVHSIEKWFPSKRNSFADKSASGSIMYKNLRSSILEYIAVKKTVHDLEFENLNEEIIEESGLKEAEDDYTTEKKADIPLHVDITCEIFKRCIHLQSTENTYLRMLTLETVELCILILRDYELQFHPLVHEFWSPFLKRFSEDTFILKAFEVLLAIVNECADFVGYRTCKEVIPKLVQFLKNEKSKSLSKCNLRHYQWSSDHKLQILVLSEIGFLCAKLDINCKYLNDVANVCLPYLVKEQPPVLQDAAFKSLKALATLDPDAVWFYWNELYSKERTILPPHKSLLELNFPFSNNSLISVNIDF